ncbi:hypothetical protein [Planctomycetes bacterium TBK1r]|uniref:ADP-ribosylation factor-directed GTPase activating protein n=1 Tax=Stieleria magnilauensis TaxID=2527963 RepID=A0ABX5XHV3_9BACT|nr:hypothetical protein TBK1r_04880 [Planctomycetes bacterium TBK1r]
MKNTPPPRPINRRAALSTLAASALITTGCPLSIPESLPEAVPTAEASSLPVETLVAETLRQEKQRRGLSTMVNGAWQIFHGILAYGDDFEIDTPSGRQRALTYFRKGGTCDGFRPMIGDPLSDPGGDLASDPGGGDERFGIRVDLEPSTKVGQGHRDQWLAVVAQTGLPVDASWVVEDRTLSVDDWVRQAELDIPLNYEAEFSWTLIPLSYYRATDHRWTARDGNTYSTELLLELEVEHDLSNSVCGGTHRLIGIATAMRNRIGEGNPITGVWADAKEHLDASIEMARVNQNPDGSYSTSYLHRTGWCNDLGETLGTTGHVLEFLATAADRETLQSDWVVRSVRKLCDVLHQCRDVDLECGVLYHALHGLVVYQQRVAT